MIKSFRDLEVYQESYQLMILIHQEIVKLPFFEKKRFNFPDEKGSKINTSQYCRRLV